MFREILKQRNKLKEFDEVVSRTLGGMEFRRGQESFRVPVGKGMPLQLVLLSKGSAPFPHFVQTWTSPLNCPPPLGVPTTLLLG